MTTLPREFTVQLVNRDGAAATIVIQANDAPDAVVRAMRQFGEGFTQITLTDFATGRTYDVSIRGKGAPRR